MIWTLALALPDGTIPVEQTAAAMSLGSTVAWVLPLVFLFMVFTVVIVNTIRAKRS